MAIASYSPVDLVNQPKPKIATPDTGIALPPVPGAGTAAPAPGVTPVPIEGVTALPFGNGVTPPVSKYDPNGVNTSNPIAPGGSTDTRYDPILQGNAGAFALPGAPVGDPSMPAYSPVATGADPNGLLGTLIAPPTGGTPGSAPSAGDNIEPGALDPRVGQWNSRVDSAAGALENTDRRSALQSLLSDFDKQSTERTSNLMDLSGRKSAALGRVGSGMAAQDINQITRQALGDREVFRNQLAADTIDKEISDRFGKLSAFGQAGNDAFGQSSSNRGFQYGVDSGNRDFKANQTDRTAANARLDRNEYRTERDYQNAQEQQGIDRKLQQVQVEEALKSGDFSRALQLLQQGKTGSPAGAYAGASSDLSGQSAQTAQLLQQFLNSLGYSSGQKAA
jgi:hypothetical protein